MIKRIREMSLKLSCFLKIKTLHRVSSVLDPVKLELYEQKWWTMMKLLYFGHLMKRQKSLEKRGKLVPTRLYPLDGLRSGESAFMSIPLLQWMYSFWYYQLDIDNLPSNFQPCWAKDHPLCMQLGFPRNAPLHMHHTPLPCEAATWTKEAGNTVGIVEGEEQYAEEVKQCIPMQLHTLGGT